MMPISDPLLRTKLNVYGQEYGVFASFERSAIRMRMRQQDQNIGAYLAFQNDMQEKYFAGFKKENRVYQGFYQIVTEHFKLFPQNLNDDSFYELAEHIRQFAEASIDGSRMILQQLVDISDQNQFESLLSLTKRDISHIHTSELNRMNIRLREIQRETIIEEQRKPKPSFFDSIVGWGKNNKVIALGMVFLAACASLYGFFKMIKELSCLLMSKMCSG
jgi:hypothetical protein